VEQDLLLELVEFRSAVLRSLPIAYNYSEP